MSKKQGKYVCVKRRLRIYLVLFLLFCSLNAIALYRQQTQITKLEHQKEHELSQLTKLKSVSEERKTELKLLQTDEYIGKVAREKYFLSKEGELIFVLPEGNKKKKNN